MQADDESTATQLHKLLIHRGHNVSLRTVLRCRTTLGWTFHESAYCQLICTANKVARLQWARDNLSEAENGFEGVSVKAGLWTDGLDSWTGPMDSTRHVFAHVRGCLCHVKRNGRCAMFLWVS